jgi:hypothetical protein
MTKHNAEKTVLGNSERPPASLCRFAHQTLAARGIAHFIKGVLKQTAQLTHRVVARALVRT